MVNPKEVVKKMLELDTDYIADWLLNSKTPILLYDSTEKSIKLLSEPPTKIEGITFDMEYLKVTTLRRASSMTKTGSLEEIREAIKMLIDGSKDRKDPRFISDAIHTVIEQILF